MTTEPGLPAEWARLHPASPLIRAGRSAVGLITIVGIGGIHRHQPPWFELIAVAVAAAAGLVYWRVTKWRVHASELQIDTGLLRRQQIRVPLTRIQGIDLVRPLLARVLGVSELRLVLAGHDTGQTRLAYLGEDRAILVRAQLLALAHGLADTTPEPDERPILAVPSKRIVAAGMLGPQFTVGIVLLIVAVALFARYPGAAGASIGAIITLLSASLLVAARRVSAEWAFQIAEAPDGLRLRSGLLQTRAETIPHGRVQAVRWVEPLWWRPFGWVRLEVDVARHRTSDRQERESGRAAQALLPVGSREEARWLLSRVLPGAVAELGRDEGVPGRARWREPLAWRFARVRHDANYISCCTGRFRPDVVVVPLAKVQSVRWEQGPWSRWLRLGSVKIDTAGRRFTGVARFRDEAQAQHLITTLPELARTARASP